MRLFLAAASLAAISSPTLLGQSMLEGGAMVAGSSIGSAAGKKLSDSLNTSLKTTAKVAEKASKTGAAKPVQPAQPPPPPEPLLQVSPGVTQSSASRSRSRSEALEANNVPLPPPSKHRSTVNLPVYTPPEPVAPVVRAIPKPEPLNVDLSAIPTGTPRAQVLAKGQPSARISMYEDGHLVEIYQYRNATLASGTLRLQDGIVTSVIARP